MDRWNSMENLLPKEIILDILSRLPTESVFECRRVSRTLQTLLNDTNFADMHLHRQLLLQLDQHHYENQNDSGLGLGLAVLLFLLQIPGERNCYQCYYREYDENDLQRCYKKPRMVNHPPINCGDVIVGSCNGLICFPITPDSQYSIIYDPVYICNPVTREYVNLPRFVFDDNKYPNARIASGFGYNPSTNEYKVVRILYRTPCIGMVQVYTLGDGSGWRNKGEITYSFRHTYPFSPGILANGAVHWMLDKKTKIVAFDLADEKFHLVPSPPYSVSDHWCQSFELQVLRGSLCFVHKRDVLDADLWLLKKKSSSSSYVMEEQEYGSAWSWSREFRIEWKDVADENKPFTSTYFWNEPMICHYEPEKTSEKLVDYYISFLLNKGIPHMNSFVSLKALGEEDVQTIGSGEGVLEQERL